MENKRFDEWNELKKSLHSNDKALSFHEREVWWYASGENIGREINGKGPRFSRPILIIRKYGDESFFGIPLSTRDGSGIWFSNITIENQIRCALLSQASSYSVCRLYSKICKIQKSEFDTTIAKLQKLIFKT